MTKIVTILTDGFADWETSLLNAVARGFYGADTAYTTLDGMPVVSMGGMKVTPDFALTDLDASGPPLPGAKVCAATARGQERCTEAANDGVASFSLPPSTYLLRVNGPDATRWMTDNRVIDVTGADTAVWLATLPDDGPSGGLFKERKPVSW